MIDMTQGNEGKLILKFALPMIIGGMFQQLYNTVDSIIVGRFLGEESLAAVGVSFPIMFFMIALIWGVGMGANIIVAQFFGAKDYEKVKRTIGTTYIFILASSLLITIIGLLVSGPLLKLLKTPQDVYPEALGYLKVIFIGSIGLFGYNMTSAMLRGLGDSKNPLYFQIVATFVNIILDVVFIVYLKMGVEGAAWATIIAQTVSFIIAVIYLNRKHPIVKIKPKEFVFDKDIFAKSIKIGVPSGLQQILVSTGMMAIMSVVNPFGTIVVAGYTAGTRLNTFGFMPIMSFGMAASTFSGQNLGAGKDERLKKGLRESLKMSMGFSIFAAITVILTGKYMVSLFNTNPEVIKHGYDFLVTASVGYLIGSVLFIYSGIVRGAGETFIPLLVSVISLWVVRVPFASITSRYIGTIGIWMALPIGWILGSIFIVIYYYKGNWKRKVVVKNADNHIRQEEKH